MKKYLVILVVLFLAVGFYIVKNQPQQTSWQQTNPQSSEQGWNSQVQSATPTEWNVK